MNREPYIFGAAPHYSDAANRDRYDAIIRAMRYARETGEDHYVYQPLNHSSFMVSNTEPSCEMFWQATADDRILICER